MGRYKHKSGKSRHHRAQLKQQKDIPVTSEKQKKPDQHLRSRRGPWKEIVKGYEKIHPGSGTLRWKPPQIAFNHRHLPPFPTLGTAQVEAWPSEEARQFPTEVDSDSLEAAATAGRCRIKRLLYGFNKDHLGFELVDYIDQLLSDSSLSFIALAYRFKLCKRRKVQKESDRSPLGRQKHLANRFLSYCFSINEPSTLATWISQLFSPQVFSDLSSNYSLAADLAFVDRQIQLIWQTGHELGAVEMRSAANSECKESFRARRLNVQQATMKARTAATVTYVSSKKQSRLETSRNKVDVNQALDGSDGRDGGEAEDEEDEIIIVGDNLENRSPSVAVSDYGFTTSPAQVGTLRDDVVSSTRAMLNLSSRLLDQNSLSNEEHQVFSTWLSTVSTVTAALSYKAPDLMSGGGPSRRAVS